MKLFILILLCFFTAEFALAQKNPYWIEPSRHQADSLKALLTQINNDSTRMYICRELGFYYDEIQRDSSLYYYKQQLLLAQKLKLKLWEAEAYCGMGLALTNLGDTPRSLQVLLNGESIADNNETERNVWHSELLSEDKNPLTARMTILGRIYSNMGVLYIDVDDMKKLLANFFKSRKIAEKLNDKALLSIDDMNLGEAYTYLDKLDSALFFEQEALQSVNESDFKKYKGFILQLIGNIYLTKENYDSAKKYYYESIETDKKQQNLFFLADADVLLADLFEKTGKTDSSLFYSTKGLGIFQTIGSPEGKLKAYKSLSSIYKLRNNIDSAFVYQGLAMAANDSLNNAAKIKMFQDIGFEQQLKMQQLEKERIETQDKIRTYAMLTGIIVVLIIAFLLYRNNRNRKKANEILQKQKEEIEVQKKNVEQTLGELKSTQAQLIHSEKMASLGELTAGIAHEIKNPLNFVNNFSEVSGELIDEMIEELEKGNNEDVLDIVKDLKQNLEKINHHGKRADSIVKGMLLHSRGTAGEKTPTDINDLLEQYVNLAYHGMRAQNKDFNITIERDYDKTLEKINVVPQDISRVFLNIINNGCYAANDKKKKDGDGFSPTIRVSTKNLKDKVEIRIKDNGNGVPDKIKDKLFQPFFTTKPTGEGTGLGLSLSYDIVVKQHGGEIKIESKEGEGAEFVIQIPVKTQ
jgi:signal transduction histidine kinase